MFTYSYTRALVNGLYDIENISRVNGESHQIHLGVEIEAVISGNSFKVEGHGVDLDIIFNTELSAGDETILDQAVSDHKENRS